jgi:soluble lytic murein transglycosylase-like protein
MALTRKSLSAALAFLVGSLTATALPSAAAEAPQAPFNPSVVLAYAELLQRINPALRVEQCRDYARAVLLNSRKAGVDPHLVVAVVTVESRWRAHAVSPVGALGLGQLMPGTAASLAVDPDSPHENLWGTSLYLRQLFDQFKGQPQSERLAIGAYNAGPAAVTRFGDVPPYYETQNYVRKVLSVWAEVRSSLARTEQLELARSRAQAAAAREIAFTAPAIPIAGAPSSDDKDASGAEEAGP